MGARPHSARIVMPLFSRKKSTDASPKTSSSSSFSVVRIHGSINGNEDRYARPRSATVDHCFDDEADSCFLYVTPLRTKSRLSPSFDDLLLDSSATSYFLQYLSCRNSASLMKFWLDANSFYASAQTRLGSCDAKKSELPETPKCKEQVSNACGFQAAAGDTVECSSSVKAEIEIRKESGEFGDGPKELSLDGICVKNGVPTAKLMDTENCKLENRVMDDGRIEDSPRRTLCSRYDDNVSDSGLSMMEKLQKSVSVDAVKIFTQYVAKDATHPIGVCDKMRNEITAKICREDGQVDLQCFSTAQQFVCDIMRKDYFPDYLLSHFHCKYQIDVLTSSKVYLEDILYNDTALSFFTEFLEQEGKRSLLEFWLTADNFRQHLSSRRGKYEISEAQDDAMVLYDKYFSLQATCPLGFSDAVRFEVEQNICREEGPLPDCFEKPVKVVFTYLQRHYLKPFLSSQLYFTFLSDLLSSARTRVDAFGIKKRSGSDTSSEHSAHSTSTQNTLLAMDTTRNKTSNVKKSLNSVNQQQDLKIDTDSFQPDALWKRNMAGKLSFGRVSNLGQFIPELEPEPDKKKFAESVLSKAMRKFINRDEDKAKEEMAWQVAEMIVREVTDVTCQSHNTNTSRQITRHVV